MKILYTNVIEQNANWGAEYFVNKSFHELGFETYCIDFREHRYNLVPYFLNAPLCDVFFLQRGDYFPIPILKAIRLPRFFWASELVSRCRDQDRLFKSGLFDHIFLRTNGCIDIIVKNGWSDRERCSVLLSGFDENVFKPFDGMVKDIDVLFVGTMTERRQDLLEKIDKFFKVQTVSAFGEKMAEFVNRSKIVLNIHAENYLDTETRVYEVLGCGGFLLTEKLSPENPFAEDELVQFDTIDNCLEKISFYLNEPSLAEDIARKGYQTAVNKHTYTERARKIGEIMSHHIRARKDPEKNFYELPFRLYELEEIVMRNSVKPFFQFRDLMIGKAKTVINRL